MSTKPMRSWKPWPYQQRGVGLMISQACAGLLLRPGLGKTTTTYASVKILKDKKLIRKTLVIAPLRVCLNVWPHQKDDWHEFTDLTVEVLHGGDKEQALKREADMYCVNPEGLEWLCQPTYETKVDSTGKTVINKKKVIAINGSRLKDMDAIVVDESTKFKAYNSNRFALIKAMLKYFKRRYILTGTITPNGLQDLFGQIYILDEGRSLGRFITHFRNKWFTPGGYGGYEYFPKPNAKEEIGAAIAPLVIQIDHKDHLVMPTLMPPNDIIIQLPAAVEKQYTMMMKKLKVEVDGGTIVAKNTAVASGKCRQIANGCLYEDGGQSFQVLHDEKLSALEDLLEQLNGEPLLIAYQFRFDPVRIGGRLKIPSISTGDARKDMEVLAAFRSGKLPAVMGHPESISLGLDGLQDSCSNICWYGLPWNLLHYLQTIDRVWRQGSRADSVSIHRIIADVPVERRTVEVLDDKESTQDSFLKLLGELTANV